MSEFDVLQTGTRNAVSQEPDVRGESVTAQLAELLPQMRTTEDFEAIESQGFNVRSDFGVLQPRRFESDRVRLGFANRAIIKEATQLAASNTVRFSEADITAACIDSARLVLSLILAPPKGVDICTRNPKVEFPQLARGLLYSRLHEKAVPFVVPACPDTNQYRLGDGLGEVVPKALSYCEQLQDYLDRQDFSAVFDVQVADVEGLDAVILENTGETSESHFAKTKATIEKARVRVDELGLTDVTVSSMQEQFVKRGLSYTEEQKQAAKTIDNSQEKRVRKTVDGLLEERVGLGNFARFDESVRRELVVSELAGYAAYGAMVGGEAVILSPDAMSAIPAYHFAVERPEKYSPVMYAK